MAFPFGPVRCDPASVEEYNPSTGLGRKRWGRRHTRVPTSLRRPGRERPVFETLEPRLLLSADLTYIGPSTDLTLKFDAGLNQYQLVDDTDTVVSFDTADASNTINITGTAGADSLGLDLDTLGSGKTINFDGFGDDTLKSTKDSDQTLTNTSLDAGGQSFTISGFEKAELTGGNSANTLDASAFTGDVTLSGLGGADRLIGGTGNDTLIGGLGDDVYEFADNWGVDTLTEVTGEGTDRLDFTATTGTLKVDESDTKRITSGAHTLTNLDTAAEELDIAITSDIQDSLEIGFNAAKDLITRLTSSVTELSSALPMLDPDTGSFSALFGLADMFQELREQIDSLGAGVNLSDVTGAITNLPGVGSAVNLSPGYQGDASNNLEIVVDAGISKSILNQLIDIDLGTEGAFLNFNIDAQLSVDATFAGSVGIGVTTVGTPTAFLAGAELDFTVNVDGDIDSAALDLGFLDVTVDGAPGNEISYSGGLLIAVSDPVDNKIALSEVTDLGFDLASLVSVTPTGTGFTTGDLNVTVQSGINLPGDIPLTSGILNIVFPTFTDFYNGVLPTISLTSGTIDLLDFSNITPGDVAGMLSDLVDTLSALAGSELLDQVIPLTGVTLGDLLDFGEGFRQEILDPLFVSGDATVPDFDGDGIPDFDFDSIQDLVAELTALFPISMAGLVARFNPTDRELVFNMNFSSLLNIGTSPISLGASLGDLAGISTTSEFDLSTSFDFNLDFGIGLGASEDIELLPSPFSPDNVAELSIAQQDGAAATDFSVQIVRVDNATLGSYKLGDPTGAHETGTIQYNASAASVAAALNSMAALNGLGWAVQVTKTVEGNDSVYTVVFKDATDTDKSFNPSGVLLPPLDDADNTLKGAADGVLSSTATFDIKLFSKAVTLLAGTAGEFTVPESELGSITVTVNRDTGNASLDDLKVDVQTQVNTQLVNQGLTLGFLSGGELSTGAKTQADATVIATGAPIDTLHEDVEFTVVINGADEYTGILRAVDVLDTNGDDELDSGELAATVSATDLGDALEAAIFGVLDSAGLASDYNVSIGVTGGNLTFDVAAAPGTDTVELVFKSPVTVDSGGGRIAFSTPPGTLSAEVFNPSVATASRIEVSADYNDTAFQEMGLLSAPTPFDGVLDDDIEFTLDVNGTAVDVFLSAASTAGNTSIDDLLTQLNTAVDTGLTNASLGAGLVDVFRVDPDGNRLGITGDHTSVDRLSIDVPDSLTTGPNAGNANGAITELGFESGEGDPFAGASAEFFIDNVTLDANASIDATTLNLVANVGFLEVEADGSGSISANANLSVINPLDGGTRVNGETLIAAVSQGKFLHETPPGPGGTLDNLNTGFLNVAIGGGLNFSLDIDPTAGLFDGANNPINNFDATLTIDGTSPNWLTSLPDVNVNFTGPDFDAIISEFKDLSFQDIIDGLSFFVEFLQSLDGTSPGGSAIADALDFDLPLINRSVADLVQIADDLADRLDALSADPSGSVQALNDLLVDIFDLPAAASNILSFNPTTSVLGINLGFDAAASLTRPFSLNLADVLASAGAPDFLTDLVSLEAGGNLGVSAGVDVELALGLDLTGADKGLFLFTGANGTRLAANASATGNNLSFRAGLGPFQVLVDGGSGTLGAGIDLTLNDDGDGRLDLITLGSGGGISLPSLGDLNIDIIGIAEATLPLFVGSVDNPIPIGADNEIILSADLDDLISGVPGAFNVTLPNLDLFSNPPGIFELLADPAVVVDGLDAVLLQIQEALEGQIFGFELPFVADALKDNPVSNFIEDFRDDFLNPLANTLRANNVNLDGLIGLIQDSIFNTFDGLGILKDSDGVGGLTADDIVHTGASLSNLSEDFIQFDFKIGQTFVQELTDIDFDFNLPGLGLEADFTPTLTLDWNLDFGFGLDETKGFYFVTSDPDELTLSIDLDLGSTQAMPAFASGQLLFLALGITDGIDLDDDGDLEFSGLNLTGAIDVADPNDDGRLTIGELISGSIGDIFQPSLTGSADILMQAEVDFTTLGSADLARVLPSISTGIIVHWGLSATPNTGLVVDDPSIVLADVSLDLGSFISEFAAPILGNIADIIEPLDFLIGPDGFLNKRIPLLSDLAGKTITGRDLIETFDPTAKIGPFLDAIAELFFLIDLVDDAEAALASTGSLNFNFGDLVLSDPTSFFDTGAVASYLGSLSDRIDLSLPNLNKNSVKNVNFKNMSLNAPSQQGSGGGQAVTRFQSGVTSAGALQFNLFDPATIFSLLMGQDDVTLFTYELPEFGFNFFYKQKFPIFGPLTASLGGGIGGTIDLGFGYDTRGLQQFIGSFNPATLINGFFLNDLDPITGEDRPEATLTATIVASAQLDFLIASAGVEGGVDINIFFNLADLDHDGKIRFDEMAANLAANSFNPLSVFDTSGVAEFFLRAFIEINLLVTKIRKTFEFVRVELFSFDIPFNRPGILATQDGDVLTLSIGSNSENRLNGNVSDISEKIHVKSDGSDVLVWSDQFFVGEGLAQRFSGVNTIIADGGLGNDEIDLSGLNSGYEVIVHGGVGNDVIVGSKGDDELYGDAGNDTILGMGGADLVDGGTGNDNLYGDFQAIGLTIEGRSINSIFGGTEDEDTLKGGAGNDNLFGNGGNDTLDAGTGTDSLDGGAEDDVYLGLLVGGANTIATGSGFNTLDFSDVRDRVTFTLRNGQVVASWEGNTMTADLDEISTILGGRSDDTFHVYETRNDGVVTLLDGQQKNDKYIFYAEDGDPIDALVNDQGNAWDNGNIIEARGTTGDDTISLTDATISLGGDQLITYVAPPATENILQIKLKSRAGRDDINIKSTAATVPVTVFSGEGDDTITVGDSGTLDNIDALLRPGLNVPFGLGPLTLVGEGGHDTVVFDDSNEADNEFGNLTSFIENRAGNQQVEVGILSGLGMSLDSDAGGLTGRVEFEGFEAVDVRLGGGADDFRVGGDEVFDELTLIRQGNVGEFTNLIDGIVSISGNSGGDKFRIEATNDIDRDALNAALGIVSATTTTTGGASNEVQRINVGASIGYFTLKFRFMETAPIALDATAAQVQEALEDLFIIGTGNVSVTKDAGGFDVEFVNDLANTDVEQLEAKVIPFTVFGNGNGDQLFVQSLTERMYFQGGTGDDLVKLNVDATTLAPLATNGVQSEITLDGGENSDTYQLGLIGGATDSLIHVFDSGLAGTDVLEVTGTENPDLFLLRAAAAESGLAFIALMNTDPNVERINYNTNLEVITIDSLAGEDEFYIDDTRAAITINSGADNDFFQVGQLYKSRRTPELAGVAEEDVFATIETTRGFLSNGISNDMTINAGDNEDEIIVFHNLAVLTVNGEAGDDTILVQAFALVGSQEDKRERTDVSGGADADFIAYAVNAPVNIDGGDGFDTVIVVGTEFGDDFVITENGVFGAGLNVNFTNVEKLEVNGAEGDDRFFVQSTGENFTTSIVGDRGSDTFFVNGETPANGVISNDLKGHSGIITHSVESTLPGSEYDGAKVVGVSSNVADNDEPAIIINQSDGQSKVVEGGVADTYTVILSRPPRPATKIKVTALPPEGLVFVNDLGNELRNETTGAPIGAELIFDDTNWNVEQEVRFKAIADGAEEGNHTAAIQHKVSTIGISTGPVFEEQKIFVPVPVFVDVPIFKKIHLPFIGTINFFVGFETQFSHFNNVSVGNELVQVGTENVETAESDAFTGVIESATGLKSDPVPATPTLTDLEGGFPTAATDPTRPDGLRGAFVTIIDDPANPDAVGQTRLILSNTATTLTLDQAWDSLPSDQARYEIGQFSGLVIPTVEVAISDADVASLVVTETQRETIVSEGASSGWDIIQVALSQSLGAAEVVTVNLDGHGQLEFRDAVTDAVITSLTFNSGGPATVQEFKVLAVDDGVTEGFHRADLTLTAVSNQPGSDFNGVEHTLVADIGDDEFAGVLVKQTNGSTDVVEGGDDPAFGGQGTDSYTVVLTKELAVGEVVTVAVTAQPTRTSRTGTTPHPDSVRAFEVEVEVSLDGITWAESVDVVFDDDNPWDVEQTVFVRAVDDSRVDGGDSKVFAPILDLANNIKGPLFIVGGFGEDRSGLFEREPIMLPGETNFKESMGDVLAATEADEFNPATLTLDPTDPDVLDFLGRTAETVTANDFLELTVEITRGEGKNKIRIIEAAEFDLDGNVVLTLNKAWDIPFTEPGVPTALSEFTLSDTNPNFLVDEATQTDLLFFKDTDNPTNFEESAFASGQLFFDDSFGFTGHRITGLGMGGDRNIGGALQPGGVTFQQLEEVEIVLGSGNNQFTIEDTHAGATTLKTGDGADVVNVKSINGHTFVNTGEDSDTVNVTNDGQTLEDLLGLLTLSGDIPQAETVHFANGSPAQGSVPAVDAIQHLNIDATGGTFTLSLGGESTVALAHDASEGDVQAALESLSTIGAGNVEVTKAGSFYRISFINAMGGQVVDLLAVNDFNLTNGLGTHDILNIDDSGYADPTTALLTQTTLTGLSTVQTNEVQTLVVDATAGTFRLSFDGEETADLAHTITASDLEEALENLAGIGDGNVAVTQNDDVYVIRFQGDLTNTNVSDIIVSLNNLEITTETYPDTFETVVGDASVHTRVSGDAANAVNDMQQLTVNATGGTYTLSLLGRTTGPIAYDASAEVVRKALQVLVADDESEEFKTDVTVDKFGRTYLIGFQGKLNELNGRPGVELLVVDGSGLTDGEADVATRMDGINYYGFETLNLSLGSNNDILNVQGTSPGSNGFAAAGGIAVTNIDLGAGNEQIFVSSNADLDFGSADAFQFLTGDLDDIEGALNLDTGDGRHRLMISDEGATAGDGDVTITDTLPAVLNGLAATADIWIQGLSPAGIAYGTDGNFYDGITYWTGSGADTISIDGSHLVNGERTTTTLNTGLGNDNVTVDLDDGEDGFFVLNTMGGAESANPALLDGTESDDDDVDASDSTLPLTIFGGIGNDTVLSGSADDIIFGDFGRVIYTNALGAVVAVHGFGGRGDRVSSDILPTSLMFSLHRDLGGSDTISGRAGGDEIFGGNSGDTLYGDDATESSGTDDKIDVIFGDNGVIELEDGMYAKIKTTDTTDATGGADTIEGNADDDIVLAGVNGSVDVIHGNDSKDVILGDNGELDFSVDGDLTTLDTVRTTDTHLGGEDHIFGFGDDDLIFGGTGDDQIHGGTENDIIFGDFGYAELIDNIVRYVVTIDRTEGGMDTIWGDEHEDLVVGGANSDRLDGGEGRDLLFGDNVELDRLGALFTDYTNPRFRTLTGDRMYGETPGVDDGEVLVASTHYVDPTGSAVWADFEITLLDHSATDEAVGLNNFGDDYMAGGAGDDQMFGMLGDDTMQGDGSIDLPYDVTAYRTALNMLMGNPSVENALTDGDDYIEGNGGTDVIFGNLGQDDIIGGSSNLFSLLTAEQRPDGMDILFGGAGTDLARNDMGDDTLAEGHALDSDAIAGDNANIFRLLQSADPTQFESFNYDNYSATLRIIPRPVEFLDYTQGGPDIMGVDAASLGDIGDNDEIHGESGDDFIYGMVGNDVLYGEGQDDDIIGGWGHDWISGGTGSDGVLGDDGRIYTSRNTPTTEGQFAEPLYGIETVETDQEISSNSPWFNATIHAEGELKKTVNLTPFNVDPNATQSPLYNAQYADDIIYGGLGDDFLHGGSGDDAISGAEALATSAATVYPDIGTTDPNRTDGVSIVTGYFTPFNPGNVLSFEALVAEEFASYDENDPRRKIMINGWEFFLNFDETEGPIAEGSTLPTDGNDRIFGDLGNDWIVGGTGRDHTYGGYGNDLLNNDDNHNSTAGTGDPEANDEVDGPEYSYEDISLGGAGRDILIANTAGDRQVDSTGEYNSFVVPQSPFGPGSATRGMEPGMIQFFYDLSEADGVDPTRAADTGSDPERNGEPHGELGLVTQQDPDWGDQHGAPDDPQAGNGKKKSDLNGPRTAEPNSTTTTASSTEMQKGKKNGHDNNVETTASSEPEPTTTESETLVFDDGSGSFQEMATTDEGWVLDSSTITNPEGTTYNVFDMTEEEYLLFISTVGAIDDDGDHTQVLIDWDAL